MPYRAFILIRLIFINPIAQAEYQNEISVFYSETDYDNNPSSSEATGLHLTHFFDNVATTTGPWVEASFIQRAGYISFLASQGEYSSSFSSSDSQTFALISEVATPDSNFILSKRAGSDPKFTVRLIYISITRLAILRYSRLFQSQLQGQAPT